MTPYNSISLTHYAATVSKIMGMEAPALADAPLDWAVGAMKDLCKEGYDRLFIHNPDAVGMWLWRKYPDAFAPVLKNTQLTVPFKSVMPSVTPVCFGTMYTGAEPAVHGIQKYEKPVIKIDTSSMRPCGPGRSWPCSRRPAAAWRTSSWRGISI